jgi:hypothetical protein
MTIPIAFIPNIHTLNSCSFGILEFPFSHRNEFISRPIGFFFHSEREGRIISTNQASAAQHP